MTSQSLREHRQSLEPLIEAVNREYYPFLTGELGLSRALAHWAMRDILNGYHLNDEELVELTRIGGSGDCGVDGWYLDEEEETPSLYLFQAKHGATLSQNELSELQNAPLVLLDPQRSKNAYAAQLSQQLKDVSRSRGGSLLFCHFVTMASPDPAVTAFAQQLQRQGEYELTIDGTSYRLAYEFRLWTAEDVHQLHQQLLRRGTGPDTWDTLTLAGDVEAPHYLRARDETGAPTISFFAPAIEIARIFNGPPKRWSLFVENPRGAQYKRHPEIWKALENPTMRHRFHALNNGISIVCDEVILKSSQIRLRNMRIVNGCQTTLTLGEALTPTRGQPRIDDKVLVPIRLTETKDDQYRQAISDANNRQKQVTPADRASRYQEMLDYHEQFASLSPKHYFEIQSGNWNYMMTPEEKARYSGGRIEREPLAQAVLAMKGKPGEALDDRQYIFVKRTERDSRGHYQEVFVSNIPAEQMLLAWKVFKRVQQAIEVPDPQNQMEQPDYTRFSGLHRVWLIFHALGRHYGLNLPQENMPRVLARTLADSIDRWFAIVYNPVSLAVWNTVNLLRTSYPEVELRNFFRLSHTQVKEGGKIPDNVLRENLDVFSSQPGFREPILTTLESITGPMRPR